MSGLSKEICEVRKTFIPALSSSSPAKRRPRGAVRCMCVCACVRRRGVVREF